MRFLGWRFTGWVGRGGVVHRACSLGAQRQSGALVRRRGCGDGGRVLLGWDVRGCGDVRAGRQSGHESSLSDASDESKMLVSVLGESGRASLLTRPAGGPVSELDAP